ncbi:MAG: isoprenyl transferase [Firmicutes bacterium]|nr:isoprenyl transferase [Bacillota bacterium]
MFFKKKVNDEIDYDNLPRHIGIIMDGNGRWAKKRGLPRNAGHKAGSDAIKKIVRAANAMGVEYMTAYAFSTENWKRPKEEVDALMDLLLTYLKDAERLMHEDNMRLRMIGSPKELSPEIQEQIIKVEELTKNNDGILWNIAINYGGREEIANSAKRIAEDVQNGIINPEDITADTVEKHLYTAGQPDVDLLIRTSGEMRLSNFMLWQVSYAEFWYTDKLWPDFTEDDLKRAIIDFQNRGRRFGGV